MAMNGNTAGTEWLDALQAVDPEPKETYPLRLIQAGLIALFAHIEANAEITIDDPSGLADTAGNPPSPSHTGTATGGIS